MEIPLHLSLLSLKTQAKTAESMSAKRGAGISNRRLWWHLHVNCGDEHINLFFHTTKKHMRATHSALLLLQPERVNVSVGRAESSAVHAAKDDAAASDDVSEAGGESSQLMEKMPAWQ